MNKIRHYIIWMSVVLLILCMNSCNSEGNDFDSSFIPVLSGEKWGFINFEGKYVINPQFDEVSPFLGGYAIVKKGDKYGYINRKGEYAINPQYESATTFSEGVAWVTKKGTPPILINEKGEELLTMKEAERCYRFSDGLALVSKLDEGGDRWFGFIDKKGNYKIDPRYCVGHSFSDGVAYVKTFDFKERQYTAGFINKSNDGFHDIIPDSLELNTSLILNGLFHETSIVRANGSWKLGVIDRKGTLISPLQFTSLEIDNGEFFICRLDGGVEYGWCDKTGKIIINPQFEEALPFASNHIAPVRMNGEFGYIDKEGKFKINPQFEEALPFIDNKVALVKSGDKYGLIDRNGKYIANPQFNSLLPSYIIYAAGFSLDEYVTTDYYDIDKAVSLLDEIVTEDSVDGITLNTSFGKILKKYEKEDMSPYGASGVLVRIDNRTVGNMFDIEVALEGDFITYVSDGWWGQTGMINKNSTPDGIQILVKPIGQGRDRGIDLMKAFAKAHGVTNCDDEGTNFVYGIYDITLIPNIEGFSIVFHQKAGAMSAYDPEEDEIESESNNDNRYTGKIDGKYEIVMDITISDDHKATGQYYYTSKNVPIELDGNLGIDKKLILEEKVDGKVTGVFTGDWYGIEYSGVWKNADGSVEMPFLVKRN